MGGLYVARSRKGASERTSNNVMKKKPERGELRTKMQKPGPGKGNVGKGGSIVTIENK